MNRTELRERLREAGFSMWIQCTDPGTDYTPSAYRITLCRARQVGFFDRLETFEEEPPAVPRVVTPYTMGCAHRRFVKSKERVPNNYPGKPKGCGLGRPATEPMPPVFEDVLQSLLLDAECVRHGQPFEEFCNDLGYNPDSRKDHLIYLACQEIWHGLVRLDVNFEELTTWLREMEDEECNALYGRKPDSDV